MLVKTGIKPMEGFLPSMDTITRTKELHNMNYYYIYRGTVFCALNGCRHVTLGDTHNLDKPPVVVTVPCKGLADYLENRSWTDEEERYITQGFLYDRNLFLRAVIIPGKKEDWPAKVIACKDPDHVSDEVVIFGPEELLTDPHPASMDTEEYHKWLKHRGVFGLHPRNEGRAEAGASLFGTLTPGMKGLFSVTERLPEWHRYGAADRPGRNELVWACRIGWKVPRLAWVREDDEFTDGSEAFTPTHWMPIGRPVVPELPGDREVGV